MLKKIGHIILSIMLLVTTMGMTVSEHFCGDSLKSVAIQAAAEKCCDIPDGCCHDESITIKVKDDFSVASHNFDFAQFAVIIPVIIGFEQVETEDSQVVAFSENRLPPPKIQKVLSSLQTYRL